MKVIRPTGGFEPGVAAVPTAPPQAFIAAFKCFAGRLAPQLIYRTYFAMPKIAEFASRHNRCAAKK